MTTTAEVHVFKASGKWYTSTTIEIVPNETFAQAIARQFMVPSTNKRRCSGMLAVCIDDDAFGFPQMVTVPE